MTPPLDALSRLLTLGPSLLLVTSDASRCPNVARCGAAQVRADGTILVAVALPEGERALANVTANGRVALTAALPTTYETLQAKGSDARRVPWAEIDVCAEAHRALFEREVIAVGLPPGSADRMWSNRFDAIVFTPSALFEQTPGPRAGLAVQR